MRYVKHIPIIPSKLIKLIHNGILCHSLHKLYQQIFRNGSYNKVIILPTYRGRKTKVMLYVHHQSFKRPFRTKNGPPQKAAVRKPGNETFKQRNTSNDLGLSSSFSSSTSWQNQHRNYICVSSFCKPRTLSDYLYFPLFVVFFHFKIWFM